MTILEKLVTIAAKVETTVGTKETLAAADGQFNAFDIKVPDPEIPVEKREGQGGFGRLPGVPGARKGKMSFKTWAYYDGSVPPYASTLLPGCGWINAAGTFNPKSQAPKAGSDVKTLTLGAWQSDGSSAVLKQIYGAMGNWKLVLVSGKVAIFEWEFEGLWEPPVDQAIIAPTYPTPLPSRFADAATTFDSTDLCVGTVTIDAGNTIQMRECPDTIQGYESAIITDRHPKITLDPEARLIADDDPWGDLLSGLEAAFATTLNGASGTIGINAPKAQHDSVADGARNGIVTSDIDLMCNKNGATQDQELSIVFTP